MAELYASLFDQRVAQLGSNPESACETENRFVNGHFVHASSYNIAVKVPKQLVQLEVLSINYKRLRSFSFTVKVLFG